MHHDEGWGSIDKERGGLLDPYHYHLDIFPWPDSFYTSSCRPQSSIPRSFLSFIPIFTTVPHFITLPITLYTLSCQPNKVFKHQQAPAMEAPQDPGMLHQL